MTISPAIASVVVGNTLSFIAFPRDQFGTPIGAEVTWNSSNTGVGIINGAGVFTAIAAGMTTITATSGNISGTGMVTVTTVPDTKVPLLIVTKPIDNQFFITNSITVSGTATDPSGIANVKVNGIPVNVSSSGSFSTTIILVNGSNIITIIATDASPNANMAIVTRTVTFTPPIVPDTTPPILIVTQPTDAGDFMTNSIMVNGFATDDSGIFSVTVNGAPAEITDDSFTFSLRLNPGTNTIIVEAIDGSSSHNRVNVTRTVTYAPLPDTMPPTLVLNQPTNGLVLNTSSVVASGTATDDSGIQAVSVNGAIVALRSGPFSTKLFLVQGTNTITVAATDNAGNSAAITRQVIYSPAVEPDFMPPTLILNQPENGQVLTSNHIIVSGTAFDSSGIFSVMVNGNAVSVDSTGSFSAVVLLTGGNNTITIAATDASPDSNKVTMTRTVTYSPPDVPDTTPPLLIVSQPADGQVFTASQIIVSGRATDDSGIRSVAVNGVQVTPAYDGRFGVSIDLKIGSNAIIVQAIDSSSNLNTNTVTLTLIRVAPPDNEPPVLVVAFPPEGLNIVSPNNVIKVFGTVSDDTGVQSVKVNGIQAALIGGSFNSSIFLGTGPNLITVIAIDNSTNHNFRIITRNVTYTVPVTGPGQPSIIRLVSNPPSMEADGKDAADIVAHVTDANGTDVVDGTKIIFTTSDGRLFLDKADADILPGSMTLAARTNNGIATVVLISSINPGDAVVTAQADGISESLDISFKAISYLQDEMGDTEIYITHSPTFVVENCSIEIDSGIGNLRTSTEIAVGIVNGTRIGYKIGISTINIIISDPIILGDQVIYIVDSIRIDNSPIIANFTGIGNVGSKVDTGINNLSKLNGMTFVMSLHPDIADDIMAKGGRDAGLVGPDVILSTLRSSPGITNVGIAFVTSAQLDGATVQDILEVSVSMTVSGNWYRTEAASTINNVRLAKIYSNGTVGQIQTPQSYTYDAVNDSYTFAFSMNGFSTFALVAAAALAPASSSGSVGGSGVVTSEPYVNIEKSESYYKSLIANRTVTYTFKVPDLGIYEIAVTGKENENDIALRVEVLKSTSKLVTVEAPGIVYKNVNMWAGTKKIKNALIRFKVENSWLINNSLDGSDIKMVKWDGSQWTTLETTEKTREDKYTFYEAKTDTFSLFAITGLKSEEVMPTATPAAEVSIIPVKPTGTTPSPTKKVPGFELVPAAGALGAIFRFARKRRCAKSIYGFI